MRFSMKEPRLSGLVAEILYTNEEVNHFLFYVMERTSEGIIRWLERRIIPKSRKKKKKNLKVLDIFDFSGILALIAYIGTGVYHIP